MKRFPWVTLALVALTAAAALVPAEALEYDRSRVAAGEVWRLLTGQLVHWTARMAIFDIGMLLGLGIWLEVRGDRRLAAITLALGGALTALAVHALSPDLLVYRGSSGVASALFVLAAVRISETPDRMPRALAITAVALFLAKAAFEAFVGQTLFAGPLPPGVRVVPLVHLLGGMGGLVGSGGDFSALVEWPDDLNTHRDAIHCFGQSNACVGVFAQVDLQTITAVNLGDADTDDGSLLSEDS